MAAEHAALKFQVSCHRCGGPPTRWLSAPGSQREDILEALFSLSCEGCGSPYTIEELAPANDAGVARKLVRSKS